MVNVTFAPTGQRELFIDSGVGQHWRRHRGDPHRQCRVAGGALHCSDVSQLRVCGSRLDVHQIIYGIQHRGIRTLRSRSLSRPRQDHSSPPPCCPRAPRSVPGESLTETVVFSPTAVGTVTDSWIINAQRRNGVVVDLVLRHGHSGGSGHRRIDGSFARILARRLRWRHLQLRFRAVSWLNGRPRTAKTRCPALSPQRIMADTGWTPQMAVSLAWRYRVLRFDPRSWAPPGRFGAVLQPQ